MTHSKKVCKILKEIRRQVAEQNDIALVIAECHYKGECKGTCPRCEAEVRFLENELNKRRQLGKAVAIAGISLGMAGGFTECLAQEKNSFITEKNILEDGIRYTLQEIVVLYVPPIFSSDNTTSSGVILVETRERNPDAFKSVENPPKYSGGVKKLNKFIASHITYPKEAIEKRIEGNVMVEFIVEKDGAISNIKVIKSVSAELDQEAIRVVKMMPNWKPGKHNGELVRCFYTIPIKFSLE